MARTQKTYSIVTEGDGGLTTVSNLTADELREEIAAMKDDAEYLVFVGEAVPVTVSREPVITIGKAAKRERKSRAKSDGGKKSKGTTVGAEFFDGKPNGKHNQNDAKQE